MTHPKLYLAPPLSCSWSKDGMKLCAAGADKAARMMDLTTGQTSQIGAHDQTISVQLFNSYTYSSLCVLLMGLQVCRTA